MATSRMRVLLTGGAGYVGGVLRRCLQDDGHEVFVVDDFSTGNADAGVHSRSVGSAKMLREVFDGPKIDVVVHLAARSLVGESVLAPENYWEINAVGTFNLLQAMRRAGCWRIIFASSAAVYGEPEQTPILESCQLRPCNPYGATKVSCEWMIESYCKAHGFAAASLRIFNVAGASLVYDLGERRVHETHLIPLCLDVAMDRRKSVAIYGAGWETLDGSCMRDYVHVEDVAKAFVAALNHLQPGEAKMFNVGSGQGTSVLEVIASCEFVTGKRIKTETCLPRAGDPPLLVASIRKAAEELGWQPNRTIFEIIESAWMWRTKLEGN